MARGATPAPLRLLHHGSAVNAAQGVEVKVANADLATTAGADEDGTVGGVSLGVWGEFEHGLNGVLCGWGGGLEARKRERRLYGP